MLWNTFASCSRLGKHPEAYGVRLSPPLHATFANNDINFTDSTGIDHDLFGPALKKALYNYMHGIGLDVDVRKWFAARTVPRTRVPRNLIERALG
jgi:hypothetical protein